MNGVKSMRKISILLIAFMICSAGCGNLFYSLPSLGPQKLQIVDTYPADGDEDVSLDAPVVITFNKDLDESSVNPDTFVVTKKIGEILTVKGNIVFQSKSTVIFDPEYSSAMDPLVEYSVKITDGVKDTENINLQSGYSFKFKTCPPAKPVIISTYPRDGANDVSTGGIINITFSKVMDASSFDASTFKVVENGFVPITGDISATDSNVVYFDPEGISPMKYSTEYTVTITNGVKDTKDIYLESDYTFSFTTAEPEKPKISSTNPINGVGGVPLSSPIEVTFNKLMIVSSFVYPSTVTVTKAGSPDPVNCVISFNDYNSDNGTGRVLHIDPEGSAEMNPLTVYTVTITDDVIDSDGLHLEEDCTDCTFSFSTKDRELPVITGTDPDPETLSEKIPLNQKIAVTFNNLIDASSVSSSTFIVTKGEFDDPVSGVFTFENYKIIFDPEGILDMEPLTLYKVRITTGVKDKDGQNLEVEYPFSFTTADNDTTPPKIISTEPGDYSYDNDEVTVTAVFDECIYVDINDLQDIFKLVMITDKGELNIDGSADYDPENRTVTFTPDNPLEVSKTYKAYLYPGIKDCASTHNMMDTTTTWTFRHLKTYSFPCIMDEFSMLCCEAVPVQSAK